MGVDLHRRRSVIVVLDGDGTELWTTRIDNSPLALGLEIEKAGPAPEVVLEATWGWYWAADVITAAGGRVHLAHPLGIAGYENRRVKNDQEDARLLADLLRMGRLPEAWIPPESIRHQRELVRYRRKLSQLRAGLKSQIHAVLGKEGLVPPLLADGVNLTFVSDCCHSGSITRAIEPPDSPNARERYLPCPLDLWAAESGRALTGSVRGGRRARERAAAATDVKNVDLTEVLVTGCRADQTSADAFLDGDFFGALTHSVVASLRDTRGAITYRDLHTQVLERLAVGGFDQTPQLEGQEIHFDARFLEPFGVSGSSGSGDA